MTTPKLRPSEGGKHREYTPGSALPDGPSGSGWHPGGREGGTYRKLADATDGRPAYQRARALHVRTAEGLIPLPV